MKAKETIAVDAKAVEVKTSGNTKIKADGDLTAQSGGKASVKSNETTIEGAAHKLKIN